MTNKTRSHYDGLSYVEFDIHYLSEDAVEVLADDADFLKQAFPDFDVDWSDQGAHCVRMTPKELDNLGFEPSRVRRWRRAAQGADRIAELEAALEPFAKAVDVAGYLAGGPINIEDLMITPDQEAQMRGYPMASAFINAARVLLSK